MKNVCSGSGKEPKIVIQNDWWVGKTGICPVCHRNLKITKTDKVPHHQLRKAG